MAFDLEPGKYTFEMKYVPAGAWAGVAVSGVSIILFVLTWKRVTKCAFPYPGLPMKERIRKLKSRNGREDLT